MGFRTCREFLKTIPCSALVAADLTASPKVAPKQLPGMIDPRGPIRNPGMTAVIGDGGVQAEAYIFPNHIEDHTP